MDELPRNAMQLEHIVTVQLGHPLSSECCVSGKDMDLLAEPVHKDADCVVSLGFWERTNEVYRYIMPWFRGDRKRVKGIRKGANTRFQGLTFDTCFTVKEICPAIPGHQ